MVGRTTSRRVVEPPGPTDRSGRRLGLATAGMLLLDGVGGGLAVASGWNTPAEAWSGRAVAAAPAPVMVAQAALAAAAVRRPGRRGAAAAGLLAAVCLLSSLSGFFDGQLGRPGLPRHLLGVQLLLVGVTSGVGALAAVRARRLLRSPG
ncbi:hypothetical protein GCM10027261_36210 [Geodermatophilus arenarius]|uniref:Uncharacterized protein n=1 Tax=Geodermatophilus arenarius TaxID=1137990 RepID=A0ABV9LMJ1_9ACTN